MQGDKADLAGVLWALTGEAEFWSAIVGAIVGGFIAFAIQLLTLKAAKTEREENRLSVQQALANSLLFKVVRIHSNIYGIHHHIEICLGQRKAKENESNPWPFFLPLANPPEAVTFSSDEMGMLLGQKNNEVFNSIMDMDVSHNSLIEMVKLITVKRREVTDRLKVSAVDGSTLFGVMQEHEMLALQPRIIEVNSLIVDVRTQATRDYKSSRDALGPFSALLRDKLKLTYTVEPLIKEEQKV